MTLLLLLASTGDMRAKRQILSQVWHAIALLMAVVAIFSPTSAAQVSS
jgi:hypothetical protein